MTLDDITVDEITVDVMTVDEITVEEMTVYKMTVGEMPCCRKKNFLPFHFDRFDFDLKFATKVTNLLDFELII